MNISKELFCKTIKSIQDYSNFIKELDELLYKYQTDGQAPLGVGCDNALITILDTIFTPDDAKKAYDNVDYFIYELNFGKEWKPGMITDSDGTDIDFSSAEKLYDYLVGLK